MKIVLVAQEYPPETARGGIGTQTFAKANGLTALGHSVYVISRSTNGKRHENNIDGVHVIRIAGMEARLPEMTNEVQWITHSTVVAAELEALHKRKKIDIIDFPEWGAEGYVHLLNRTPWHTIPTVIQLHGPLVMLAHTIGWPEKHTSFYKVCSHMEAACVQLADAVYSSSGCSAQWIRDHYHPAVSSIPIIHMGVDAELFAPQAVSKHSRPTIVFAGKLAQNKGVIELLKATIELSAEIPGLQLRLLGNDEGGMVQKLLATEGALDVLQLAGYVHKEDLPAALSQAHVFAAPSYYEGGPGFVYLEAMACGLPVIGCTGSGVQEIIAHGVNGLLVPPRNVPALTNALRNMFNNTTAMQQMGLQARAYVQNCADTRQCVRRLEAFYYSVLQKTKVHSG